MSDALRPRGRTLLIAHRAVAAALAALLGLTLVPVAVAPASAAPLAAESTSAASASGAPSLAADMRRATEGRRYVALGDSYAAGYGLGSLTGRPVSGCGQSRSDYPHQVAATLGLDLTDVTCAGATTSDVVGTKQLGAAPQSSALSSRTDVVTISIGGNDAGLFATASSCVALSSTGPVVSAKGGGSNCRSDFVSNGHDSLAASITGQVSKGLTRAFSTIRSKAPHAKVFVVGYPTIFPDSANTPTAGCFRPVIDSNTFTGGFPKNGFPFTDVDVKYLAGIQKKLDATTSAAAVRAGFTYLSTAAGSEDHSGCASPSKTYLQGITLKASTGFRSISLVTGALHPNERGAAFLADRTTAAVRAAFEASSATTAPGPTKAVGLPLWLDVILIVAVVAALAALAVALVSARRRRRAASARRR